MTDYPLDMQLVVDPLNPENVVRSGAVYLYDPSDEAGVSPIALKDPSGLPLPNPLTSNAFGFTQPCIVTIPRVKWKSGTFEGFFYSYDGLRNEAVAAKEAAHASAGAAAEAGANAAAAATAGVADVVASAADSAAAAQAAAALVGAPADDAIAAAVKGAGATKAALNATYARVSDVKARAHLVTGTASSATDFTALQAAVNAAAAAGVPLITRGPFTLTGGTVTPPSELHMDARGATFTQADSLRPAFNLPARSSLTGGKVIGKGTDWVNTTATYDACAVRVSANDVTVRDFIAENMAGAGVYAPVAISGLKVLDCFFDGPGSAVIPASTGQFGGGVVFGNNGVSGFTLRGGRYRNFAQGVVTGHVSDFFIGGGLEVGAVGQHGLYLGAVNGGSVSGLRVNGVALQGIKAQLTNGGATDGQLFTIGDTVIRNNGSHGVLLTNVDAPPTSFNRRAVVHDVVIEHAAGGTGDGVTLQGTSNVSVHDVISRGGVRGLRAVDSSTLNIHHNSFSGYTKSGMALTSVTDSDVNFNSLRDGATANDAADEFGVYVLGATSANLRFAHNRISDAAGNTRYAFYIAAGDLPSMSFAHNTSAGMSDYGFRSATTTNTKMWIANELNGALGKFLNMPTNAGAIADTAGVDLAALEAEVNKLKARMRAVGTVN